MVEGGGARVRAVHQAPVVGDAGHVLDWMVAARRVCCNPALERAAACEGRTHNHLRMLWGKKILEWSESPRQALATMFELNHRYALDGRDPNSSSGILWTLGRFDRPWRPERPTFGTVRYTSPANTACKYDLRAYLETHGTPLGRMP